MKGKKCIKYLILCITFLLSLNLSLNASAITPTNYRNITSVDFEYYAPATPFSDSLTNSFFTDLYTINIPANSTRALRKLVLNMSSIELQKDIKYKFSITFFHSYNYPDIAIVNSSNVCPLGSNGFVVDKCSWQTENITPYLYVNSGQQYQGYVQDKTILNIEGHYNKNATVTKLELQNGNFEYFTNVSAVDATLKYQMGFSTIIFYTDENSTDEAAQKELEDRDNLETQQTESEDTAEDSTDSFETSTTNITGVISGFVTSLNNLQIGNCTLPEISAYGFSLGNINLCTFTPPTWIQGVTTVIISLITLGLAWHVFRRIMGIAKSIAGSK